MTPSDDDGKIDLGEKSQEEVLEALTVFQDFDHPYDGQFVPKVYLRNSETVYVVTADSGKLSCVDANDPNHAFVDVAPAALVDVVFEVADVITRDDEPAKEEEAPEAKQGVYWLNVFLIVLNVVVGCVCLGVSINVFQGRSELKELYEYRPVMNATEAILLKRHARGVFFNSRFVGGDVVLLKRRGIAEFYLIESRAEEGVMELSFLETRTFTFAKVGDDTVLRMEGLAPVFVTEKDAFIFYNQRYERFEGTLEDFATGIEKMPKAFVEEPER